MTEPANIKPLTSLRFFAALWVTLYHYWPKLAGAGPMPGVIAKGYLGVELFFVLSGFILCHVYLPAFEEGRFKYADFIWARLARIYPMHLATLIGIGLMGGAALAMGLSIDPNVLSLAALPANLTLTQAWGLSPVVGWNDPSWSISAEWFAYLVFPAFALLATSVRRWPEVAAAAALAFMAVLYAVFARIAGFPLTLATISWGALRIVPTFAMGCALYLVWRRTAAERGKALASAGLFGAGLLLSAQIEAPDVVIVAASSGLIISLAQVSKAGARLGTHPLFVYLGEISYCVYMLGIPWSLLFVNISTKLLHLPSKELPLPLWAVFVTTLVPLSAVAHHVIERPLRQRMKLWWANRAAHKLATAPAR